MRIGHTIETIYTHTNTGRQGNTGNEYIPHSDINNKDNKNVNIDHFEKYQLLYILFQIKTWSFMMITCMYMYSNTQLFYT